MKSITRLTLLLGLIITTISCSIDNRDPYVEYNHGFTTDVFTPEKALLLQETPFKLQMNPNLGEIIDLGYTMEYRVTKGEGYFKTLKDSVIDKAKPFEIETDSLKREQEFIFIPTTKDQVTIAMKVWDTYGGEQEFEVNYTVENPPFTVSLTPETTTPLEKTTISINLDLVPQEESDMQYQVKLNTLSDLGSITTQEGTTLVADKWYPITVGTNLWQFEALNIGEYPLSITVKDEFEQEVTQRVSLTIKGINFALKATAAEPTIFETATTSMTLNLSQDITEITLPYEVRLNTVSNVGTLQFADGTAMMANTWYDLPLGDTALRFTSTTDGVYNAEFTVRIKGQPERTDTASRTITVKKTEFTLEGRIDKSEIEIRNAANQYSNVSYGAITLTSELLGLQNNLTYDVSFTSTGIGKISRLQIDTNGNDTFNQNEKFTIDRSVLFSTQGITLYYIAESSGRHNINLLVNASNGVSKMVSININVKAVPVVFNIKSGIETGLVYKYYINFKYSIHSTISSNSDPVNFEIRFTKGGRERIISRDFRTVSKHPSRGNYLEFDNANLLTNEGREKRRFYEGSSFFIRITTENNVKSDWTAGGHFIVPFN